MAKSNRTSDTSAALYDFHEDDFEFVMCISAPEVIDMHTPPEAAFRDRIRRLGGVAEYRQTLVGEGFDSRAYLRSMIRVMLVVDERQDEMRTACAASMEAESALDIY